MKPITTSFKGVSYLFPRSIRALKETLNGLPVTYTFTGEDGMDIEQVLTITPKLEWDEDEIFSLGMLVMQTILLNRY